MRTHKLLWLFPIVLAAPACSGSDSDSGGGSSSGGSSSTGGGSSSTGGGSSSTGGGSSSGGGSSTGGSSSTGGGSSTGGSSSTGGAGGGSPGAGGGTSSGGAGSADVAGSCDQGTACNEYPTSVTGAALDSVRGTCPGAQGTWQEGQPCRSGHGASCRDYANGTITLSSFYYDGTAGMLEGECTGYGGVWSSSLPDYAGSCIEGDYKCVAFVGQFDTPAIAQSACTNGTYSADPCPEADVYGSCTSARVEYFYNGHPQASQLQTSCEFYGTWAAGG